MNYRESRVLTNPELRLKRLVKAQHCGPLHIHFKSGRPSVTFMNNTLYGKVFVITYPAIVEELGE